MQSQANAHRTDKQLVVGNWVFVKLHLYRQSTLSTLPYHKLTSRYFSPYPIVERVSSVAYKLLLPPELQIHPAFHISQLKFYYDLSSEIVHPPVINFFNPLCPFPEAIFARRLIKKGNKVVAQCFVKWKDLDNSYATWEVAAALKTGFPSFTLEDKVLLIGDIDTQITAASDVGS
ncbi:uncharacterized protein LOC142182302 [Nicotiana tabacum]|uniref:Uncharacterized protein LOC142182302 n=1 Tax=Nicotiana tabacum TaxID=4097 RepID=A0AC58UTZ2_TOBAC